jgi:hypothetical protein
MTTRHYQLTEALLAVRQFYAKGLAAELQRFRTEFGGEQVDAALKAAKSIELRRALERGGERCRRHDDAEEQSA